MKSGRQFASALAFLLAAPLKNAQHDEGNKRGGMSKTKLMPVTEPGREGGQSRADEPNVMHIF